MKFILRHNMQINANHIDLCTQPCERIYGCWKASSTSSSSVFFMVDITRSEEAYLNQNQCARAAEWVTWSDSDSWTKGYKRPGGTWRTRRIFLLSHHITPLNQEKQRIDQSSTTPSHHPTQICLCVCVAQQLRLSLKLCAFEPRKAAQDPNKSTKTRATPATAHEGHPIPCIPLQQESLSNSQNPATSVTSDIQWLGSCIIKKPRARYYHCYWVSSFARVVCSCSSGKLLYSPVQPHPWQNRARRPLEEDEDSHLVLQQTATAPEFDANVQQHVLK